MLVTPLYAALWKLSSWLPDILINSIFIFIEFKTCFDVFRDFFDPPFICKYGFNLQLLELVSDFNSSLIPLWSKNIISMRLSMSRWVLWQTVVHSLVHVPREPEKNAYPTVVGRSVWSTRSRSDSVRSGHVGPHPRSARFIHQRQGGTYVLNSESGFVYVSTSSVWVCLRHVLRFSLYLPFLILTQIS